MKIKNIINEELTKHKYAELAQRAIKEMGGPIKSNKKSDFEKVYNKILEIANNKEDIKENKSQVMAAIRQVLRKD